MEQLPDLALLTIFEYLGIQSLVRCQRVSKRFKSCVDLIRPKQIALNELETHDNKWRYRDELIQSDCQINDYDVDVLSKVSFDLRGLRRLKISNYALYQELDGMMEFVGKIATQLEHLEIVGLYLKANAALSLPRLEVLFIDWPEGKGDITVNAPALRVLSFFGSYGSLSKINLIHPNSIKHLELFDRADETVRQFGNVETLRVFLPRTIDADLLRSNRNLKTIYLLGKWEWDLLLVDQTKTIVDDLLQQKRATNKNDHLKIYFFDQLLEDGKPYDDYAFHRRFAKYFYLPDSENESDD